MMVAWAARLAETGTGILRRRVVEAAFHGGDNGVVARAAAEVPGVPSADLLAGNGLALVFFDEGQMCIRDSIKGVLDLFTAMLISASIGSVVGVLAVPQCAIQFALLFGATMLMPYTTPTMFADFSACGGIIMLGAGLRQMGLVQVAILSMLPGLFFVMPLSALWKQIM